MNIEKIGTVAEVAVAVIFVAGGSFFGPFLTYHYHGFRGVVAFGLAYLMLFGGLKAIVDRAFGWRKRCAACLQTIPGKSKFCPVCGAKF